MSTPKRHHYVPQFLLHNFTDENGDLHFFTKKSKCREVLKAKTDNVFHQKHLYASINDDGSKDNTLEKNYSQMEAQAADLIKKIIKEIRLDKVTIFSDQELRLWTKFFFNQWKRVPDMHKSYFSDEKVFQALADTPYAKDNPAEHDQLISELKNDPKIKKNFIQTMKVSALGYSSGRVEKAFEGTGLGIDRKSTRLNSSHDQISYAVFCLKKKNNTHTHTI